MLCLEDTSFGVAKHPLTVWRELPHPQQVREKGRGIMFASSSALVGSAICVNTVPPQPMAVHAHAEPVEIAREAAE